MKLSELRQGDVATILKIEAEKALKQRFHSLGLVKGGSITIESYSLAKKTFNIRANNSVIALRSEEAETIEVAQ